MSHDSFHLQKQVGWESRSTEYHPCMTMRTRRRRDCSPSPVGERCYLRARARAATLGFLKLGRDSGGLKTRSIEIGAAVDENYESSFKFANGSIEVSIGASTVSISAWKVTLPIISEKGRSSRTMQNSNGAPGIVNCGTFNANYQYL